MSFTLDQVADYDRDGYLLVPELFNEREVAGMIRAIEDGGRVAKLAHGMADASGRAAKLALWQDIGDDIWGAATVSPRIINGLRILVRDEVVFFHGKVMLKEANSGGAWEWHQDYGYWYGDGYVYPRLISAFVALDPSTRENGCLQVLRGSHKLGRLEHGSVAGQAGANIERVEEIEAVLERVHVEMAPGSVLFFDCNLLHSSSPNNSEKHRRSFIVCFNSLNNPKIGYEGGMIEQHACEPGSEEAFTPFL